MRSFVVLLMLCFVQPLCGAVVEVDMAGTFASQLRQNTVGAPYPFEKLLGGSFEGKFSIDVEAFSQVENVEYFRVFDVRVSIFGRDGELLDTILDYPDAEFREFNGNGGVAYLGKSYRIENRLQDLRLTFEYKTQMEDGRLSVNELLAGGPLDGFIETDPVWDWDHAAGVPSWNVGIADWRFSARVVPEPRAGTGAALSCLFGGLTCFRQKRHRLPRTT